MTKIVFKFPSKNQTDFKHPLKFDIKRFFKKPSQLTGALNIENLVESLLPTK